MASSLAANECCNLYITKQMECQLTNEAGRCAFCVKLPCKGGMGGNCADGVHIFCANAEELEKCCEDISAQNSKECCVCVQCKKNELSKVLVKCCGTQSETSAEAGKAVCICVPKTEGGKCGGKVQVKQCDAQQLDECCKANTAGGDCCCVCLSCSEQKCVVTVRCPVSALQQCAATECGMKCC